MTKSELKTGMIVITREGKEYMVFRDFHYQNKKPIDCIVSLTGTWSDLLCFNEDLTCMANIKDLDIMKVKVIYHPHLMFKNDLNATHYKTIWERPEPKKMTVSEIEAILGYKIEIIAEKENYYD